MAYPKGTYRCRITGQGFFKLDNEKQTEYFGLTIVPQGRVNPDDPDQLIPCEDWPRTVKLWLTAKSVDITGRQLVELGWDGERFVDLEPATDGCTDFTGNEVTLYNQPEQSGDRVFDNFSFPRLSSPSGNGPSPASEIAVKLDRLMGNKSKPKPKPKKKAEPKTEPDTAEIPDDEVPF